MLRTAGAAALLAAMLAAALPELGRGGYSPDEEFTVFAVRGIAAHGLPLLPSGLLYDRGVAYSYSAWLASVSIPQENELIPARIVSFVWAMLALCVLWVAVRRMTSEAAAWVSVVLVASCIPFWAAATSARFYAPFLGLYLAALALMARDPRRRAWPPLAMAGLFALAAVARLTHELAFTLAAVPLACAVLAPPQGRASWVAAAAAVVAGLAVAQAGLFALHFLAPGSGGTMIRRFFLWQVVNLLERPPLAAPAGLLLVAGLASVIIGIRPAGAPVLLRGVVARTAMVLFLALVLAWAAVTSFERAFDYPLDLFWHVARTVPALVMALLTLLALRAAGFGGVWSALERALHLLRLGWVVFFGVIESGITVHYVLVPITVMLTAVAVDVTALVRHHSQRPPSFAPLAAVPAGLVLVALVLGTWGSQRAPMLASARPTIVAPPALRELTAGASMVACTDELGCLMLTGRVDRWLALDDFLRERFVVRRDGMDAGVYAGTPAVYRLSRLFEGVRPPSRVLVVDVFKDLPVGHSSRFLDRALAAERMAATTLLELPQLRVVEISEPGR